MYALAGALTLEEQDRALAPSPPGSSPRRPVDRHRRNVADGRRRAHRRRRRARSRAPLRRTQRAQPADDRDDESSVGRPARRPCRTHRAGRRLPAVEQDRTRQSPAAPAPGDPPDRPRRLRARAGGVGSHRRRNRRPRLHRSAAAARAGAGARSSSPTSVRSTSRTASITERRPERCCDSPSIPGSSRMVAVERSMLACVVASLVDERDILRGRPDDLPADLGLRVGIVAGLGGHDAADRGAVRRLRDRSVDLARRAGIDPSFDSIDVDETGRALLLAYPDRLAGRRRAGPVPTALRRRGLAARRRLRSPRRRSSSPPISTDAASDRASGWRRHSTRAT